MRKFFILAICASALLSSCAKAEQAEAKLDTVTLPVLMYHSILKDPSRTGEFVITPASLESDMKYLSDNGYTAVSAAMVSDFVKKGTPLPEKPIMLTFDDGHLNNLTYAAPLMEKYHMCCVINTVGAFTLGAEKEHDPNPFYAYLTREDIRELIDGGRTEIGCHTYNMHTIGARKGASRMKGETEEAYIQAFTADTERWQELMTDIPSRVYAYPFGFFSEEGFSTLTEHGFDIVLTCTERMNELSYSPDTELIVLDRFNRSGLLTTEEFMERSDIT